MKEKLDAYNREHELINSDDRILIAVSGGRDSTVLSHLLHEAGYSIGLAHMNYGLRGEESDGDEQFVKEFALSLGIPVHTRKAWDETPKDNIQLAARNERYAFFDQICAEFGYNKVATAHHFNDLVESVFINLLRGTGVHGLKGIPNKRGKIVRPMLWAKDEDIEQYVTENNIEFREDSSNASDAYARNRIRHHLIPLLEEIDPSSLEKLSTSIHNLGSDSDAILAMVDFVTVNDGAITTIDLSKLPSDSHDTWLYHCLRGFGFNRVQSSNLASSIESGKRVESKTHIATRTQKGIEVTQKGRP